MVAQTRNDGNLVAAAQASQTSLGVTVFQSDSATATHFIMDIHSPVETIAKKGTLTAAFISGNVFGWAGGFNAATATSCDGFSLIGSVGNFGGKLTIFGYAKA